jgi:uncharacterized protein YycO
MDKQKIDLPYSTKYVVFANTAKSGQYRCILEINSAFLDGIGQFVGLNIKPLFNPGRQFPVDFYQLTVPERSPFFWLTKLPTDENACAT